MKLRIEIDIRGEAFSQAPEASCGALLRGVADRIGNGEVYGTLRDGNGNICGAFDFVEEV